MSYPDRIPALRQMAALFADPAVTALTDHLLAIPGFATCSGSVKREHHHYGTGGLQQHTYEVVRLCLDNESFFAGLGEGTDRAPLFLAALAHDVGKIWDYQPVGEHLQGGPLWVGTPHKRLIHHISRSALVWSAAVKETGYGADWEDEVLHAILSHHGQRAWGSPVAPKTRIAWLLHLSGAMSARMDDWDRGDPFSS